MLALAASLALLGPSALQTSELVECVLAKGDTVDVNGTQYDIFGLGTPKAGIDGGWVIQVAPAGWPSSPHLVMGELPGEVGAGVQVLRIRGTYGGVEQLTIASPTMANGQIAYISSTSCCPSGSVWLDDTIVAQRGDAAGTSGATWYQFQDLLMASTGELFSYCSLQDSSGFIQGLAEVTTGRMLLRRYSSIPGLPGTVASIFNWTVSPNGAHWAARVRTSTSQWALIVDGAVYDMGGGYLALEGQAVSPGIAATIGDGSWSGFYEVFVNDRGEVVFGGNTSNSPAVVRNGVPIEAGTGDLRTVIGIDERGALISQTWSDGTIQFEGADLLAGDAGVDRNGNGVANPGWSMANSTRTFVGAGPDSSTIFSTLLSPPSGAGVIGIMRARNYRVDEVVCEGVPNSTARQGEMAVSGDSLASANEIRFHVFGLPTQSQGYFLASRTTGFVMQPGGSQGNLCLGGVIGRLSNQVFQSGLSGSSTVTVDLTSVPQPTGAVAVLAGETWYSQAWYRDSVMGIPTSNFSSAVGITFK